MLLLGWFMLHNLDSCIPMLLNVLQHDGRNDVRLSQL